MSTWKNGKLVLSHHPSKHPPSAFQGIFKVFYRAGRHNARKCAELANPHCSNIQEFSLNSAAQPCFPPPHRGRREKRKMFRTQRASVSYSKPGQQTLPVLNKRDILGRAGRMKRINPLPSLQRREAAQILVRPNLVVSGSKLKNHSQRFLGSLGESRIVGRAGAVPAYGASRTHNARNVQPDDPCQRSGASK